MGFTKWWRTSPGDFGSLNRKWYCAQRVTPIFMVVTWLNPRRDFGVTGRVEVSLFVLAVGLTMPIYAEVRKKWNQRLLSGNPPSDSEGMHPPSDPTEPGQRNTLVK